jgi:endonuclease I
LLFFGLRWLANKFFVVAHISTDNPHQYAASASAINTQIAAMKRSTHRWLKASALLLSIIIPASGSFQARQEIIDLLRFLDCDPQIYYSTLFDEDDDPLLWTRRDLHDLTVAQHRGVVAAEAEQWGGGDVYQAVMDLEAGTENETVNLIYSNTSMTNKFKGLVWDVEHLWSIQEGGGINVTSPSFSDVHHLRAADMTVQEAKITRHFGMCGTLSPIDSCTIPASSETTWDTAQDDKVWQPPESRRGEIARALLYMDLRYEELTLADCAPFSTGEVGYLSQLLQWNTDYPPTDDEVQRNNRACSRWQGNRNPFTDFPDLALVLYRSSQVSMTGCSVVNVTQGIGPGTISMTSTNNTLANNTIEVTEAPSNGQPDAPNSPPMTVAEPSPSSTAEPFASTIAPTGTLDPCASIGEGNLPFFLVNTMNPDEVTFLALQAISGGLVLYLTDQAWTGRDLVNDVVDEGTVMVRHQLVARRSLSGLWENLSCANSHLSNIWLDDYSAWRYSGRYPIWIRSPNPPWHTLGKGRRILCLGFEW